jgi:hypothetical protein
MVAFARPAHRQRQFPTRRYRFSGSLSCPWRWLSVREPYGTPRKFQDKGDYYNDMFVYDTKTEEFGRATSMPLNNNMSMLVVHGNTFMSLGGETGTGIVEGEFYGHHPDLFLKGKIEAK